VPNVLPFVTELGDEDARWLDRAGKRLRVRAGEEVSPDDVPPQHLFVVIEGEFEASSVVGGPVRAATDGVLLCICLEEVKAKLAGDPTLEQRLGKVISKFAPRRRRPPRAPVAKAADGAGEAGQSEAPAALAMPDLLEKLLRGEI
jgi:hypothetical protein